MITFDLKDAYFVASLYSTPIVNTCVFLWQSKLYEFTCLPFGYSLVPGRVFTKGFKTSYGPLAV